MKQIQFTSGCPNQCSFCYEPKEMKYFNPNIPEKEFKILDMNFLANPKAKIILKSLKKGNYELICGVDWRILDQEHCNLLKQKGFKKIRWAWDYQFSQQKKHQKVWKMFLKAGYRSENLMCFMIVNWKIPYVKCLKKMDLLKVWNVPIGDCCFDGGYKNHKPIYWKPEHIKKFRKLSRKHNQMIKFKIDPEY